MAWGDASDVARLEASHWDQTNILSQLQTAANKPEALFSKP